MRIALATESRKGHCLRSVSAAFMSPSRTSWAVSYTHLSQSVVIDGSSEAMSWEIGDNGFVMTLAAEVPALIEKYLPAFIEKWLAQSNLRVSDIKSWAVHPGGPRILQAAQDSLQLDADMLSASREILAEQEMCIRDR